jgi:hypothetical protein
MTLSPRTALLLAISLAFRGHSADNFMARPFDDWQLQERQGATDAVQAIGVNSDLVVLSVTVKGGKGSLVSNLRQEEFRVLDDKVEQNISVFSEEGLPLSLVIDGDLKWKQGTEMVKSLRAIIGGLSNQDEASVCRSDSPQN